MNSKWKEIFNVSLEKEELPADLYSIRSTNCKDFRMARNRGRGVGAHVLVGPGQVPTAGSGFCLWLSLTQITESCIWEPWMGSPAIPKLGKTGTQQDSKCYLALFACQVASRWTSDQWWCRAGTLRLVVARTVADIFGSFGMTCYSLLSHCYVSKIGEILPLFCPLNWRQTCL